MARVRAAVAEEGTASHREDATPLAVPPAAFVIIAAYREARTAGDAVRGLRQTGARVVVVDDGSDDGTADVARRAGATVLRHVLNRGQGAALQTGIRYALGQRADYIVTYDADGQHRPKDVVELLAPLVRGESDVVLGSRFLRENRIPAVRRIVLKAAVVFTRFASGIRVTDTHNGLRAFTRRAAEQIDIRLDRMAHASEILDQIARSGLRWVEVPVEISYTDYSRAKGQSSLGGIRVLWDFLLGRWLR